MDLPVFVSVFSKFFFILTPFFVIAVFLTITDEENTETKHALAIRVTVGVLLISAILFISLSVKITFATLSVLHGVVKHAIFAGVYR